jgi:predicted secreted hydrolase
VGRPRRLAWALCATLAGCADGEPDLLGGAPATRFLATGDTRGYARVLESRPFEFPRDHGAHPEYQSEWWYFTGNLNGADMRHFGFELTFFRFALAPRPSARRSGWAAHQAWMAHLAITDTADERFLAEERFSRQALGLAGSELEPFRIWVEDWSITGEGAAFPPIHLSAGTEDAGLALTLRAEKPPVTHGEEGFDQKGPEPGNASHYYSLTRLAATGRIRIGEDEEPVTGTAWMDREWGSSALGTDLVGWDWFALQLSDGRDLMFYRLRERGGGSSAYSGGSLVAGDGTRRALAATDVSLRVLDRWTSPASGARYPVRWELVIPGEDLHLEITPTIAQQELNLTLRYWEGAVTAAGFQGGAEITGQGYVELVGY